MGYRDVLVFGQWSNWACVASETNVNGKTLNGINTRIRSCDSSACDGNVGIEKGSRCICEKAFDLKTSTDCPGYQYSIYNIAGQGMIRIKLIAVIIYLHVILFSSGQFLI